MKLLLTFLIISMASTSFDSGKRQADSLYNNMQFREAYEVYHGLLDNYEVKKDSEKKLVVLNDLCDVCDVLSRRTELMSYLQQMLDLSIATGNDYFHSLALSMLGKRLFYEGDKVRGFDYLEQAVNLMEKTNRYDKDHLLHSQLNVLSTLYHKDLNYEKALETDQRNVIVTFEGNNWGTYPQIQQQDQRVALAKLAKTLITMGRDEEADQAYQQWKEVEIDGFNVRDYFIVDYLSARGKFQEAADIYESLIGQIKTHGDTLGDMMHYAKKGLADVCKSLGDFERSTSLYEQVLEISDTLQARQTRNNVLELAALYEAQEKDRQIQEQRIRISVIGSVLGVVLLLLAGILYYTYVMRKKNSLMRQAIDDMAKFHEAADTEREKNVDADKELFLNIDRRIDEDKLFLNPDTNRDSLCEQFGIDKNRIAQLIKTYGDSDNLSAYLNRKRIQYAVVQMRKHPNWKMQAIAELCGIPSISSFNRVFKQVYGMSPTDYIHKDSPRRS